MKITYLISAILALLICELLLLYNQFLGLMFYVIFAGVVLIKIDRDTHLNITKSNIKLNKKNMISKADKLLIFLMIVPFMRITEFFIVINSFYNTLIFYFMLVCLTVFYLKRFNLDIEYNFHRKKYLFYILLGSFIIILILELFYELWNTTIIYLIPLAAYAEEILFRGGIQNLIKDYYNPILSILLTSVVYAIFSLTYGFPIFILIFIASLLICFMHLKTRSLFFPITINIIMQALLLLYL